jgi:hypothetical protein
MGVQLFVEGPDHEGRRDRVAPVSATKERFGWLLSQSPWAPWTLTVLLGGLGSPGLLIQVTDGKVSLVCW